MNLSLNETEAIAKKAAKGSGYDWGSATEAAKSTRWLCERSIDGINPLAKLLENNFSAAAQNHRPLSLRGEWLNHETMCSLYCGMLLSDSSGIILCNQPVIINNVASPNLLLFFAANAARNLKHSISIDCDGLKAITDGDRIFLPQPFNLLSQRVVVKIVNENIDYSEIKWLPKYHRVSPKQEDMNILINFANKTYAPPTESSRLLGAGSSITDND